MIHTRRRWTWSLLLLLSIIATILLLYLWVASPHGGAERNPSQNVKISSEVETRPANRPAENLRVADDLPARKPGIEQSIQLQLVTESGAPVAGALAVNLTKSQRRVLPGDPNVLGMSGEDGKITLAGAALDSKNVHELFVTSEGFIAETRARAELRSDMMNVILLKRGVSLVVNCTDIFGKPASGVRITASAVSLPAGRDPRDDSQAPSLDGASPGPRAENAIFEARTDDSGRVELYGLRPNRYIVEALAANYSSVSPDGDALEAAVPGPTVNFVMGPLVAVAVRPSSGDLLSSTFQSTASEVKSGAADGSSGAAAYHSLVKKFPGSRIDVAFLRSAKAGLPKAIFRAISSSGQSVQKEIEYNYIEKVVPVEIAVETAAPAPEESREIILYIQNQNGKDLDIDSLRLVEISSTISGITKPVKSGMKYTFPYGKWNVMCTDSGLRNRIEPLQIIINKDTPDSVVITMNDAARRCRLAVTGPDQILIDRGFVQMRGSGGNIALSTRGLSKSIFTLPVGIVNISVESFGLRPATTAVSIDGSITDPILIIPLEMHYK